MLAHHRAHLLEQSQAQTHPSLAAAQALGHLGQTQAARLEFIEEARLFEHAQRRPSGLAQQFQDGRRLVGAQRDERGTLDVQLMGAPIPFETVEQHAHRVDPRSGQRLPDAFPGHRRQKPILQVPPAQAVALVTQVQLAQFDLRTARLRRRHSLRAVVHLTP